MGVTPTKRMTDPKYLEVRCDGCRGTYKVPYMKSLRSQANILDYAICDKCKHPRNAALWAKIDHERLCSECHVPARRLIEGLCTLHYMRKYRDGKKKKLQAGTI